ncbi:hypothetical protein TNCV_4468181 [Trichonephila clavipes]|nr:hypothetical protein TNCV_4468181 [Trichonephila clavipes]
MTSPWGHCLLFDLGGALTPRLAAIKVKESRHPIDNKGSLSKKNPVTSAGVERMGKSPGWKELGESPGYRELEESRKERRTEIGVERKERQ